MKKPPSESNANLMSILGTGLAGPSSEDPTVCDQEKLLLLLPTVEPGGFDDGKMSKDFQSWPSHMGNYRLKDAINNTADDTSARHLKY